VSDNRSLRYVAEFLIVNVGGFHQDVKGNRLPMPGRSVGAVIVLGVWESHTHGEGPQSVGISTQIKPSDNMGEVS
jgi:hypothetical protein